MRDPSVGRLSLDEYFALDAASPERLEFRDGVVFALAVPTKNHARIAGNLSMSFGPKARAAGCDYFVGDGKIVTSHGDRLIPDFVVTCDERDLVGGEAGEAIVRHPWLVVEILSPTTAGDDLGYKLDAYQAIDSVTHYVVVDARRRAIRTYARAPDGAFVTRGPVDRIELPRIAEPGLTIDAVYRDTTVPRLEDVDSPLS